MDKDVITLLNEGKVNLKFTKHDGSLREMTGTRNPQLIPVDKVAKDVVDEIHQAADSTYVPVFDLELGEWRAFRTERLISYARG